MKIIKIAAPSGTAQFRLIRLILIETQWNGAAQRLTLCRQRSNVQV